jgi:predicted DCC family thiol-disulfide oxidoreductase YuxK
MKHNAIYPLTVYFDGACPICVAEMHNLMRRNVDQLLHFEDIAAPGFTALPPGTSMADLLALLHVRQADGQVLKGVGALRLVYAGARLRGLARWMNAPGLRQVCEWAYPALARHRYRIPRPLVRLLVEGVLRRAAERRAGASACQDQSCDLTPQRPGRPTHPGD